MTDELPPLPEPAFRLKWVGGEYKVTKPNIGNTDVYTADQLRAAVLAERERCAKVCESQRMKSAPTGDYDIACEDCAAAIRAGTTIRKGE